MKLIFTIYLVFLLLPITVLAEADQSELLQRQNELKAASNDTLRMEAYLNLGLYYNSRNTDSALFFLEKGLPLARELNLKIHEAHFLENRGFMLSGLRHYQTALESFLESLKILEDPECENHTWNLPKNTTPQEERLNKLGYLYLTMGHLYGQTNDFKKQIESYNLSKKLAREIELTDLVATCNWNLGGVYIKLEKLDTALILLEEAMVLEGPYKGGVISSIGKIYEAKGDYNKALNTYYEALNVSYDYNNLLAIDRISLLLSSLYLDLNQIDSSLTYSNLALTNAKNAIDLRGIIGAYSLLSEAYDQKNNRDSAFFYLKIVSELKDSLHQEEKKNLQAFQNVGFNEKLRIKNLEEEKIQTQARIRTFVILAVLAVFMLIAFILFQNNRNRKKANELLKQQKAEIADKNNHLETVLSNLKSTQAQLIQSEKMASLGELTAGIAHEIQNPLNFVNNFSEVNKELAEELRQEIDAENYTEAKNLARDIFENEEKINHHGKRAESIVKSMLLHSRGTLGQKEITNINALCDEYLRLSYHGFRAKDKSFNADFKLLADENLPKIEVVPQDIGRVLLNLINNAFFAVNAKNQQQQTDFNPLVTISTRQTNENVEIKVADNGEGIPETIKDKIFQPFFTTKSTGQGTGLGLSLSYDIVKAHGGELKVNSESGEGTEFVIKIPIA